jgi:hypothetical protein
MWKLRLTTLRRSFQDFLRTISTPFGCGSNARRYCRSNTLRAFSTVLPIPTIPFSRLCPSKTTNVPRRRLSCGPRTALGLRGGECNSVPFDFSFTDLSAGYRAPSAACSSNRVTCIAKILDARSRSKPQRGRKLFTFRIRIFLTR